MLLELINKRRIKQILYSAAYMILVLILQDMLFSRIAPLGVKPLFAPAAAVAVGMFGGGVWGGVFGLFLGFFSDMAYGSGITLLALYPAIGFFAGVLARWYVNRRFVAYLFVTAAALLITTVFQMLRLLLMMPECVTALVRTGLLQCLWGLPIAAVLYFPVRAVDRRGI